MSTLGAFLSRVFPGSRCAVAETIDPLSVDVDSDSDLGLLKRDKKLQVRYMAWSEGIKQKYGSMST